VDRKTGFLSLRRGKIRRLPVELLLQHGKTAGDEIQDACNRVESSEIAYIPTISIPLTDVEAAKSVIKLHDALDDIEDVQHVFSNEEMSEEISTAAHAG
jgi:transcriptional/translational regulatory protein YebC/TACO1